MTKLTAKEVDDRFDRGEDLSSFFTEEVDPVTYGTKKGEIMKSKAEAILETWEKSCEEQTSGAPRMFWANGETYYIETDEDSDPGYGHSEIHGELKKLVGFFIIGPNGNLSGHPETIQILETRFSNKNKTNRELIIEFLLETLNSTSFVQGVENKDLVLEKRRVREALTKLLEG